MVWVVCGSGLTSCDDAEWQVGFPSPPGNASPLPPPPTTGASVTVARQNADVTERGNVINGARPKIGRLADPSENVKNL